YGKAAYRAHRLSEALRRYEEAQRRFPASPNINMALGQQYEHAREVEKAFDLFDRFKFPDIPGHAALAQTRYAYLWDRYDQGRSYLRPLLDMYRELRILDDTFLHIRGLPFFGQAW